MNTTKAKVSFLLFVIFIALYSTMYNPKLYFISFLATTFFILLEKTQITKKLNLPFKIPYQSIIILCILILGFLYLHNKFFKREPFETKGIEELEQDLNSLLKEKNNLLASGGKGGQLNIASQETSGGAKNLIDALDEKIRKLREQIREKKTKIKSKSNKNETDNTLKPNPELLNNSIIEATLTPEIRRYIDRRLAKERQIIKQNTESQLNLDKQDIAFQEKVYKVQKEIENNEKKITKKQQPIDKKNLLLFKQNLAKHMPEIGSEINKEIIQLFTDPPKDSKDDLSFVDKVIESIRRSYKIVSKEDRMVYVGTSSLIISFALMLLDISL